MKDSAAFGIATGAFVAEREDWGAAIAKARDGGWSVVELTAIDERLLQTLEAYMREHPSALAPFDRVSVHAPAVLSTSAPEVVDELARWAPTFDLIFHPDVYRECSALERLGGRVVIENMDVGKRFGRTVADLRSVFDDFPDVGFCLDVAHVWTNDRSLVLGHEFLDAFGDRLRQLHVSGIEPDGTHRETTRADLDLYRPILDRCTHVPWLLEAELEPARA